MTLQFDPEIYLSAFRQQQQQDQQNNQSYVEGMQGIGQGIGTLAKIPEQEKADRLNELTLGTKFSDSGIDPASALNYYRTGQFPQANPQPMFANPNPSPQMASAGMPDTGWSQESQPSSMPPMPSPTPMPQDQSKSPLIDAWNQHPDLSSFKPKQTGFSSLFQKPDVSNVKFGSPEYYALGSKQQDMVKDVSTFNQKEDDKKLQRETLSAYQQAMLDAHKSNADFTHGEKAEQFNQKEWDKIVEKHNPDVATQRSSIGISTRLINSADRALETLNDRSHPLTYQDLGNVQQDIASIYQNGSPTDSAMKHNEYNTIYSGLAKTLQSLTGNPQEAVPEGIRKQLIDRLNLLKGTSYDVINRDLDTVETGQRRVIDNRKDEWQGIRNKWKKPQGGTDPNAQQIGRFKVTVH